MAVTRGSKILQADIDALATAANGKANLEGKPYTFLPRRWIIKTPSVPARDFPPGWPGQGTSGVWDKAALSRLAGLQVGDVVINLKSGKFPFKCTVLPTVNPDGSWTGGSWIDLRNAPGFGKPRWFIVNDLTERDALGAVEDGAVCFIINNQPADLSIAGYFVEVRQGGQWRFYRGWSGELSRLRYAIGRGITVQPGGIRLPYSALVAERYQGDSFGGFPAWVVNAPTPIGTPLPDVATVNKLEFFWPDPAQVSFTRVMILPWTHAPAGSTWKTGFKANISPGGRLDGYWGSSPFSLAQNDPQNPVPFGPESFRAQLSGPLAAYVTDISISSFDGRLICHFQSDNFAPGADQETYIQWNFAPPPGTHWVQPPDGKFYRIFRVDGLDNLILATVYPDASEASGGLHSKRSIRKRDFRTDSSFAGPLTGSNLPNQYYNSGPGAVAPGANFATVSYVPTIGGADAYTRLLTTQKGMPIGTANDGGDGTEMDAYRVQFALKQFDYVPSAANLVTQGKKGQYSRTPATQSRGPNLFPNGADLFPPQNHNPTQDNLPHACACKVYPTVPDSIDAASYVAFSTQPGRGQIIRIVAVRIPKEDKNGLAALPESPAGQVDVQVGCLRNGAFVQLAAFSIAAGSNYGVWNRPADNAGILVFEFYPLVVRCMQKVEVYPLWFNAALKSGLGDTSLLQITGPNFATNSFTAVCPPIGPDHYNETSALLGLIS